MKLTVAMLIGLLALAGLSWYWPGVWREASGKSTIGDAFSRVQRGDLVLTVTENGYLKAKNSESLKPRFRRQGVITWLVEEGTAVKEGDVLVEFDATETQNQLDDARNKLIQYDAELEAAQANLEIQKRENEAAIEKAELALEVARLTLDRYEKGEYPNTLRKNQLAVEKTRSENQRAREAFEKVPELAREGYLTSIQVEEERIRVKEAEINLENAEKELELYETYTRPMELKQKQSEVRDAERELETAREKAAINMKEKEARVSQQDGLVKSTRARIETLEQELEWMKICAPKPGLVIYGDPANPWMSEQIQVGSQVWQGNTLITLPDLSEMQVLLSVHEADIDQIALGQHCVVTLDSYKGRVFTGTVTDIASVATSAGWEDETNKQFRVEISMDALDVELRSGITAKVEIQVERLPDVLHVPIHAVFKEGEHYLCFVPAGNGYDRANVRIGKSNAHYVVIEEGLDEGDVVLLYDPRGEAAEGQAPVAAKEQAAPVAVEE